MNQTSNYKFTIIVPFYNERENISNLENQLSNFTEISIMSPTCVLFVNDGSNDGGGELVREACMRHDNFFYVELKKNGGLSGALKAGIDCCESEYVGYIDADLQTNPEDFNLLLKEIDNYSLVTGIRTNRKDTFVKKTSSVIANSFRRMMTKDGVADTGCPLKVMQTAYAKKIPFFDGMHRFIPALILMVGGTVRQIPVRHYPRIAGKAKYNLANRLIGPLKDCFAYRWMKNRYIDYHINGTDLQ
ncbi:MAG: glycosyltransferase family 2 protein [Bacteroidales bacterium]|nr:glycosyltransferase family 2 protein [Bacteroidales bacterium]MDD4670535.1 glycosyltransferase family 2 protein [Bacteroidales bacterium]